MGIVQILSHKLFLHPWENSLQKSLDIGEDNLVFNIVTSQFRRILMMEGNAVSCCLLMFDCDMKFILVVTFFLALNMFTDELKEIVISVSNQADMEFFL